MTEAIRLKPDTRLRKALWVPEAMSHPAKLHIGLAWEIIERYTHPGQTILDPMAGVGTVLLGCLMGRNVICNEMEQHFLEPMLASWAKMQTVGPMLGHQMGQAVILRGDARSLPLASADAIVTSPPWEDQRSAYDSDWIDREFLAGRLKGHGTKGKGAAGPGMKSGYTRPVQAVITSPPYADMADAKRHPGDALESEKGFVLGYTRKVAAVVTSPPYENAAHKPGNIEEMRDKLAELYPGHVGPNTIRNGTEYGEGPSNIGNLRGSRYWAAMTAVYAECHRVLIPGGVMALVVKGYTRDKQYVDLPGQTALLIETLGFQVFDRWTRELYSKSFWRTLQSSERKAVKMGLQMGFAEEDIKEIIRVWRVNKDSWDERLQFEHVIAARKIGEGTSGVDAIVTSPPWEDQLPTHHNNTDFTPIGGIRHKAGNTYTRPEARKP